MLLLRWERAGRIAQVAEETLNKIYPQGISEGYSVVEKWISEEEHSYKCSPSLSSMCKKCLVLKDMYVYVFGFFLGPDQWKILYYYTLYSYFTLT